MRKQFDSRRFNSRKSFKRTHRKSRIKDNLLHIRARDLPKQKVTLNTLGKFFYKAVRKRESKVRIDIKGDV